MCVCVCGCVCVTLSTSLQQVGVAALESGCIVGQTDWQLFVQADRLQPASRDHTEHGTFAHNSAVFWVHDLRGSLSSALACHSISPCK